MTKSGAGRSCPFSSSHVKQEIILHHEEWTKITTLFLFREQGRRSVRAGMMMEERVEGIYMKAFIVINFAQKNGSSVSSRTCFTNTKSQKTWGTFLIQQNTLVITGCRVNPHSLFVMQK